MSVCALHCMSVCTLHCMSVCTLHCMSVVLYTVCLYSTLYVCLYSTLCICLYCTLYVCLCSTLYDCALQDTFPSEMPLWMSALHKKFNEGQTHRNVRIFLARLICNRSKLFQPYAKNWVTPLVQLIVGGESGGVGLHYFAVDVMVTILSWQAAATAKNITIMEVCV